MQLLLQSCSQMVSLNSAAAVWILLSSYCLLHLNFSTLTLGFKTVPKKRANRDCAMLSYRDKMLHSR